MDRMRGTCSTGILAPLLPGMKQASRAIKCRMTRIFRKEELSSTIIGVEMGLEQAEGGGSTSEERIRMSKPLYRSVDSSQAVPICSTHSLAIASLLLACGAIITGLSPLLQGAFLPLSLLGLVLAILGLFSLHDRSGLQVGALAFNGLVLLVALLLGPVTGPVSAQASMSDEWTSFHSAMEGRIVDRRWHRIDEETSAIELAISWNTNHMHGCWNWVDGTLLLSDPAGERSLELDWRIPGTIEQGTELVRGGSFEYNESDALHRWLQTTSTFDVEVSFIPTRWEHAALESTEGVLVPAPASTVRAWNGVAGQH